MTAKKVSTNASVSGTKPSSRSVLGVSKLGLFAILIVILSGYAVAPAYADSLSTTPLPASIGTGGVTSLHICTSAGGPDHITSITVTDPSGTIWTYTGAIPDPAPACAVDFTSTFAPPFGGASPSWSPNDGDLAQTDESGTYHLAVIYNDDARAGRTFDASAFFTTPEFGMSVTVIGALLFAGITLVRRRKK